MERLGIAATQRHRADILGIKRLPADRYLRLLRIIRCCARARPAGTVRKVAPPRCCCCTIPRARQSPPRSYRSRREVPRGTGEWHPHFLVDSPDIPVHPEALPIRRANGVKGVIERVTIASKSRRVVLAANGKRDRAGGKIEQVTVKGAVDRQLILTRVMQGHINPAWLPRCFGGKSLGKD